MPQCEQSTLESPEKVKVESQRKKLACAAS